MGEDTIHRSNKRLVIGIYQQLLKINTKKPDNLIFLQAEERLEHALHERIIQVAGRMRLEPCLLHDQHDG